MRSTKNKNHPGKSRQSVTKQSSGNANSEKLQKILAEYGVGSRRQMETIIAEGRVFVNQKQAHLGQRASYTDHITLDGKPLISMGKRLTRPRAILCHKPSGVVCSKSDEKGRTSVYDIFPRINRNRWIMVGRLDINTTGLLLFVTDGQLAHRLMHPSSEIDREYAVRVYGQVSQHNIHQLLNGVSLEDGMACFDDLHFQGGENGNHWYHVVLKEGRNRIVKRLWESQGVTVSRLIRLRFGPVKLPRSLSTGQSLELSCEAVNDLRAAVGLSEFNYPDRLKKPK
jgi:23S rRNA pseudouridine2605 synthase